MRALACAACVSMLALTGCATTQTTVASYPSVGQVEDLLTKRFGMGSCDENGGGAFRCVIGVQTYVDVTCLTDGSCSWQQSASDDPIEKNPYAAS
jgi:hypothetical protein